jgi:hypothetical protein
MHTGFWWGNQKEGDYLEDQSVDGKIIVKWLFEKWGGEGEKGSWTRSIWLRIGTRGGLL